MTTTLTNENEPKTVRRVQRIALSLPIKAEGKNSKTEEWQEITRLKDVSPFGAGFHLSRPVKRGRLLRLTLPLPRTMRCYDYLEPQYRVWAIVRRCSKIESPSNKPNYLLGVAFIGKSPPARYLEDPSVIFELSEKNDEGLWEVTTAPDIPDETNLSHEERRHSRFDIPLEVVLEVRDEDGNVIKREETVTENISFSGAAVFSAIDIEIGRFIAITSTQYGKTIRAIVRGKRLGPDSIPRLHVEFLDDYFPLEGIEQR